MKSFATILFCGESKPVTGKSSILAWGGIAKVLKKMEAPGGLEPPIEILQTSALPLGDGALLGL
jgi:hypothetical protein